MFKQTKIAAATIALLGAAAAQNVSAVAIDDTGTRAQVLIFPYYNVNNDFQTAFNIRNTKNETKALKLRFRESKASNDVLDFNVYMSPYDHFSLTLTKRITDGKVIIKTSDTTCTYPEIPVEGQHFLSDVYDNTNDADAREGYLEVIEMGVVTVSSVETGVKHGTDRKPAKCGAVGDAWASGAFTQGGAMADASYTKKVAGGYYSDEATGTAGTNGLGIPNGISKPTGGIQGYSILLNTKAGAVFVGDPVAIRNYTSTAQHYKSDDPDFYLLPSLASGDVHTVEAMTTTAQIPTAYANTWSDVAYDWGLFDPNLKPNSSVPSGINPFPIADALAVTGLHNDYFINPSFNAATDWVITLPMKKHGIFNDYRYNGGTAFKANATLNEVAFKSEFWDREEGIPSTGVLFSPAVQGKSGVLDREVNILTFTNTDNPTDPVLGTENKKFFTIQAGFIEGWARLRFEDASLTLNNVAAGTGANTWATLVSTIPGTTVKGVPALGFAAIRGNFGTGASTTVGETTRHVFERTR